MIAKPVLGCQLCKKEGIRKFIVLPGTLQIPEKPNIWCVCLPCAKELGIYCVRHDCVHIAFPGNTHACARCIGEKVNKVSEEQAIRLLQVLGKILPPQEFVELFEAGVLAGWVSTDSIPRSVVRFFWTHAVRKKMSIRDVILSVVSEKSIQRVIHPAVD
jgi:hypothetical protein